jgi:hypothetical protein
MNTVQRVRYVGSQTECRHLLTVPTSLQKCHNTVGRVQLTNLSTMDVASDSTPDPTNSRSTDFADQPYLTYMVRIHVVSARVHVGECADTR